MVLSNRDIKKYIKEGKIKVSPKPNFKKQLGPCSLDLHLGNVFKIFKLSDYPYLDLKRKIDFNDLMEEIKIKDDAPFILQPRAFVLATTKEEFSLPDDIIARLDGRSSLARIGVVVHLSSARFDPGWRGRAVMELGNLGSMPVVLYAGVTRICALTFEQLSSPTTEPYNKSQKRKYTNQNNILPASKLNKELRRRQR